MKQGLVQEYMALEGTPGWLVVYFSSCLDGFYLKISFSRLTKPMV